MCSKGHFGMARELLNRWRGYRREWSLKTSPICFVLWCPETDKGEVEAFLQSLPTARFPLDGAVYASRGPCLFQADSGQSPPQHRHAQFPHDLRGCDGTSSFSPPVRVLCLLQGQMGSMSVWKAASLPSSTIPSKPLQFRSCRCRSLRATGRRAATTCRRGMRLGS